MKTLIISPIYFIIILITLGFNHHLLAQKPISDDNLKFLQLEFCKVLEDINHLDEEKLRHTIKQLNPTLAYNYGYRLVVSNDFPKTEIAISFHESIFFNCTPFQTLYDSLNRDIFITPQKIKTKPQSPLVTTEEATWVFKMNETHTFYDGTYQLKFLKVTSEQRCPSSPNIQCVWGGNAQIMMTLKHLSKGSTDTFLLNSHESEGQSITFGHLKIKLQSLSPYPKNAKAIPDHAYRAEIKTTLDHYKNKVICVPPARKSTIEVGYLGQSPQRFPELKIKIIKVVNDSRCPKDAICKWAGNAEVHISVQINDKKKKKFIINTNERFITKIVTGGLLISLKELSQPNIKVQGNPNYRATFEVKDMD